MDAKQNKQKELEVWGLLLRDYYGAKNAPAHEVQISLSPASLERLVRTRLEKLGIELCKCKKCGQEMFWLRTKNGKDAPVTLYLTSHFADCKFASDFRNKGKGRQNKG